MAGVLFGAWPVVGAGVTTDSDTSLVEGTTVVAKAHKPGMTFPDVNGGLWVYINATSAALVEGDWVLLDEVGNAVQVTTGVEEGPIGVVGGSITKDDYGYAQIYGHCTMALCAAAVADDQPLFVSANKTVDDAVLADNLVHRAFSRSAQSTANTQIVTKIDAQLTFPQFNTKVSDTVLAT